MPDFKRALIDLGQLIDLMDGGGTVDWMWFANPLRRALAGVADNRHELGEIIRALRDQAGDSPAFDATTNTVWEAYEVVTGHLSVGIVWNTPTNTALQIGIGAKVTAGSGKQTFDGTVLGRMVKFPGGNPATASVEQLLPSHELGNVMVGAAIPVPDFLNGASIHVTIPPPQNSPLVSLTVDDGTTPRVFPVPSNTLAFDAARLAIYVLRAWVRSQALSQAQAAAVGGGGVAFSGSNDSFFSRLNSHLFPMLGDPASSIQPFPLIADAPGTQPSFDNWKNSIFTLNGDAGGALTFLWHLRALITGNESESFLEGSYYFPLLEADQPSGPPSGVFQKSGDYPTDAPSKGIFLGLVENGTRDLVIAFRDAGVSQEVVLARMNGGITQPKLPKQAAWAALKSLLLNFADHAIGTSGKVTVEDLPNGLIVTLFTATPSSGFDLLDKPYALRAVLREDQPAAFSVKLPFGDLELPPAIGPADAPAIFTGLLGFILNSLPENSTSPYKEIAEALLAVVDAKLKGQDIDPLSLVTNLLAAAGNDSAIEIGPLTIATGSAGPNQPYIEPGLSIGPITPSKDSPAADLHIGKVNIGSRLTIDIAQQTVALSHTYLEILDLRFGKGGGSGEENGLVGSLLPDMKQVPGFTFKVSVSTMPTVSIGFSGGGKIPLQESIGPLDLAGLLVDLRTDSLAVGVDLSFQLATITVAAYELGIKINFQNGSVSPFLHGLGLSMNMNPVKLAGMFAEVKNGNVTDYVGGAVVSVANLFELSAIGAYTQIDGKIPSLFIFASLVAPLGGPPWFFITGIAGGFGYNRSLPPPGLMTEHPFIKVMRGDLAVPAQPSAGMAELSKLFLAQVDQYWVAAGIQFNSFGFINGKLVLAVGFGNKFSIQVLGLASFGIENIAYFEIGIEASGDDEQFKLKAGISKNSYLIHPDIASLHGDFGLGVWHGGEHAGDFVFSIGGYHPSFKKPAHYDDLALVGVTCVVYGFVRMSVDCFFACTPQALMAGAKCSLAAEFAGIGAGLDVYVDVFIRWDPFFIRATMGVTIWFQFMGRHEVGVDLQIWTPPFGGLATIDLALVSFDVSFGEDENAGDKPKLYQFLKRQLAVAATAQSGNKAKVEAYNTADKAGLFRVDFTSGRTTQPQEDTATQEGLNAPVPMGCEFGYTVKTRLPLAEPQQSGNSGLDGKVYLPLCELMGLKSKLTTAASGAATPLNIQGMLPDLFPKATFGDKPPVEAQATGAKSAIAKMDPEATVPRVEGFDVRVEAKLTNPAVAMTHDPYEDSIGAERYPLPLGTPGSPPWVTRAPIVFKAGPWLDIAVSNGIGRRQAAELAIKNYAAGPLVAIAKYADLQRARIPVRLGGLTVGLPPADAPVIAVPDSPARRAEMFGVNLRVTPPKAPFSLQRRRLNTLSRARNRKTEMLTPNDGTKETIKSSLTIEAGKAVLVELSGGMIRGKTLSVSGQQMVRCISLGSAGEFLADRYLAGSQQAVLHERTERLALIGEGLYPPVRISGKESDATAAANANIGVEHDSTLLAIAPRTFAGHGCVVTGNSYLPFTAEPLDSVPSFKLLRASAGFEIYFPAIAKGSSLILMVTPVADDPGSALEGVRWVAEEASLGELTTIVGARCCAFVMPVDAAGPWSVEVSANHKWRFTSVVVSPQSARDMVNALRRNIEQDLIDDRLQLPGRGSESSAVLEVIQ